MLDRYDQSELLNLIEGELDARSTANLQARLAQDPEALALVQAMISDRQALRAIEEPALPADFLADIEPMLTRPMLIEPVPAIVPLQPGEFRRRHRRQSHRMRWGRLAAAAGVALVLLGGAWALITNLSHRGANHDELLAANRPPAGAHQRQPISGAPVVDDSVAAMGPGTVHHDLPPRGSAAAAIVADAMGERSHAADIASHEPSVIAAEFAVVMQARDAIAAEPSVTGVVAAVGGSAALVRNFSYAEAQKILEETRVARGGTQPRVNDQPTVASANAAARGSAGTAKATRGDLYQLALQVREYWRSHGASALDAASGQPGQQPGGATLAGAATLAPTLEQQLDFSSRGAAYTIAVPAGQLATMIERLSLGGSATTMLRMLPPAGDDPIVAAAPPGRASNAAGAVQPTLIWLTEGPLVKQAVSRLAQVPADAIILVPVIVRSD